LNPEGRNRSEGWRYAKLDGHDNEQQFADSLIKNHEFISNIEKHLMKPSPNGSPIISVDGSKHVESIFGDKTTSKVDIALRWESGQRFNISLKKSSSGQVWLISVPRFVSAMEYYLAQSIDSEAQIGISLFIGGANLSRYESYFDKALEHNKKWNPSIATQELHQTRLVANSIETVFPSIWESTLDFFNSNVGLITKLSFSLGLAKSEIEAADAIVYNKVKDGKAMFPIPELIESAILSSKGDPITAGPRNGGSTLQLPTGFLQMHHPQGDNLLQFHHQYKKISCL
jgi:hypothetical protein